jgi:hypothetical protein
MSQGSQLSLFFHQLPEVMTVQKSEFDEAEAKQLDLRQYSSQPSTNCPVQLKVEVKTLSFSLSFSLCAPSDMSAPLFTFARAAGQFDLILFIISTHWHCTI